MSFYIPCEALFRIGYNARVRDGDDLFRGVETSLVRNLGSSWREILM